MKYQPRKGGLVIGDRVGRWTVTAGPISRNGAWWLCRCDCGTEREVQNSLLLKGSTRSCGCLQRELARAQMLDPEAATPGRVAQRFWSHVSKDGPVLCPELGPCWIWTGSRNPNGYGKSSIRRKGEYAHRVAWLVSRGAPPTLCVLHKCDGGALGCVRPDHLFEGTKADNSRDMVSKSRNRPSNLKGERHGNAVITDDTVREIRSRFRAGERVVDIARALGLRHRHVWGIAHSRAWRHVQSEVA